MTADLPDHPRAAGRLLDANIHLLDRLVLDRDGLPVSMVDDLRLAWQGEDGTGDGPPVLTDLVLGSGLVARFGHAHEPARRRYAVPWRMVSDLASAITLAADRDELDVTWFERWLCDRVIGRIPGGRHAGE